MGASHHTRGPYSSTSGSGGQLNTLSKSKFDALSSRGTAVFRYAAVCEGGACNRGAPPIQPIARHWSMNGLLLVGIVSLAFYLAMGSDGFHKNFVGRNDNEKRDDQRQHKVSDVAAGVVAYDISGQFHRCLATQLGSATFDVEPPLPPQHALQSVMKELNAAKTLCPNATLVAVLDGAEIIR
ncbi:hypothetical protein THAOC_01000 [Thalassiosira oceanica]|uniref:Uncharacterized protein n=1 Tax=Thalassiosira oceanica TaxID=159749 RepID=K0TI46_THAOC|nr:hypothetical protein THAOC_01000 [Thalassiosira oceanica]|eukprot:EJK77185.1 hypothetical protein THAOC_01000 [Thalassiosira oceanica]